MKTIVSCSEMAAVADHLRSGKNTIGFVPTMGCLHEGHLSLVRESLRQTDKTVVSIFVNPIQFGPQEDFQTYPRDLAGDAACLEKEGVHYLFHPAAEEMYPEGNRTLVEVHDLQDKLCGKSRPGHFRGVATVVLKLFNLVRPDRAFFGQKDAQQALLIRRMAADLNLNVEIVVCPIVREIDGLAMSSRNAYLDPDQRKSALILFRALEEAAALFHKGEPRADVLIRRMRHVISREPSVRIDYIEIVDPENLEPVTVIKGEALAALAAFVGKTRLIDNTILKTQAQSD